VVVEVIHRSQYSLVLQGEVRGVVGTGSFIDSLLRVWAKRADHVDAAVFVDFSGGDGFGGLVLFEPALRYDQCALCGLKEASQLPSASRSLMG
jgi:hypothetical protein